MRTAKKILVLLNLFAFSITAVGQLTILSGSNDATQYRFVQDIATIVAPSLDFKIVNKETNGASSNLEQLMNPESPYKVAIVQSDYLYYMQAQDMRLNTEKMKSVKVIVPLGHQQIHLVTKASKGYKGLKDLEKKVVAIGSVEQGTYRTAFLMKERSEVPWIAKNTNFEDCFGALKLIRSTLFSLSARPDPETGC